MQHVKEIYILGHSLSAMDKDFFIKIKVSISPYCVWNISYHDDKAKDVAIKFELDLMITKYILLKF